MNKQFNPKEWLNSTNNQPEPINSNTAAIQKQYLVL